VRTVDDLVRNYQHVIADLTLIMGSKGVFDVTVDGELLFSKHAVHRHAEPGEVLELFRRQVVPGVAPYGT
jgi:predicted Rdx family selenoprotein